MKIFLKKFVVRGGRGGGEGVNKEKVSKILQNLIVMEATIIRDLFVMCNVKKV